MKALLEAGVHFGHQTRRWNPKMAPYIYTERNGIYIIDLQKTVKKLEEAYNFVRSVSESGQNILFVGTKKQAQEAIKEEASRCGGYYVNARWLGGMMTNFKTMRTRVDRLNQLKTMQADGTFDMLPKKEVMKHLAEIEKLEKYLGGVKEMKKLPGALFIVDTRKERNAIAEAHKLGIPVVAIADTNCDPDEIDYPIPGNDDAIRAIKLIASVMANAMLEGKAAFYDLFIDLKHSTNLRTTAKELVVPERRFVRFLLEQRFVYRAPSGNVLPYAKPANDGLFTVKDYCNHGHTGSYTLVTPQGKLYFAQLRDSILLMI